MSALVSYASLFCVVAGLLTGLVALLAVRDARLALRIALDLLLAAALLRLALPPSWQSVLAAAAIVAIRQLVTRTHRRHQRWSRARHCSSRTGWQRDWA